MIAYLHENQKQELEDFLVTIFGDQDRKMAQDHIDNMFSSDLSKQFFLIATENDQIIASTSFCETLFTIDTWGIGWVAVHPDHRKQKIATKIVTAALDEITKRVSKPSTAILSVYPDIAPLYEKLGFGGTSLDHEGSPYLTCPIQPKR